MYDLKRKSSFRRASALPLIPMECMCDCSPLHHTHAPLMSSDTTLSLSPETEGVLLVDATNASEHKTKQATFYNILSPSLSLSRILINTHSYVNTSGENALIEGITHARRSFVNGHVHPGNKLTFLFTQQLKAISSDIKQVWFADDARSSKWELWRLKWRKVQCEQQLDMGESIGFVWTTIVILPQRL